MTAQCSEKVIWEVRNVAGKGTARDIVLAVSIPCMVQLSPFQKWRKTEKETKIRGKDGQRLLCKDRLGRSGPFTWEKTLLRKKMRELLKIMKGVGILTGNCVHCLTDREITKHLVSLPGGRLKTMGRGSFMQCMISCGATCCRTLQAVRFFIAPRKVAPGLIYCSWLKKSTQVCLPAIHITTPVVWPVNATIT